MAVLPILRWPDDRLRMVCEPVAADDDVAAVIGDLFDTMYAAPGRGLAGPQIGVMKRVFVVDVGWKDGPRSPVAFVNPRLIETSETLVEGTEACLSIPGISTVVTRPDWIVLAWSDAEGRHHSRRFDAAEARCIQHELDHLNGIVTLQHLDPAARAKADADYAVAG
ncbi:peptide deformylase [Sedimentitalea sp. JM2-8]|uniref:Peptide deformylase n=1 Tax=Sedimentitalea xiamensis TaxID=3050037 RepID=A0ABT7FAE2_9RHOB|nr:peptide deformylase [Sedimentitalea xiamensis]MDK3072076.1 peptide deformylase [Sedimentitalea xiamensis]